MILDSGPMISLALNNLLFVLKALKYRFGTHFLIPERVKYELIDKPLTTKKYKFEALQIYRYIKLGIIEIINDEEIHNKALMLINLANSCFKAKKRNIKIIQLGEMEAIAAYLLKNSDAIVIDEFTLRLLIEAPEKLQKVLQKRLHQPITLVKNKINEFRKKVNSIRIIRSTELVTRAFELGFLDDYLLDNSKHSKEMLLSSVLWGLKLNGCAISKQEIEEILKLELS